MVVDVVFLLGAVAGIFAIVNPLQSLTVFRYTTRHYSPTERIGTIRNAVLTGGGFLIMFVVVGDLLFRLYRISVAAFRIAGGLLLIIVAFRMLWGEPLRHVEETDAVASEQRESLGVSPLGVPLLASPAAIGTVMLYASRATSLAETGLVVAAIAVVFLLVGGLFFLADEVFSILGEAGLAISTALMGLLLAAVAVQFVLDGIELALVEWGIVPGAV